MMSKPYGVLSDAQWARLSPLIEAVRPHGKTEPHAWRRTVEAIIWRHNNGAKWRAVPAGLGPWWMAQQRAGRVSGAGSVVRRLGHKGRGAGRQPRPGHRPRLGAGQGARGADRS